VLRVPLELQELTEPLVLLDPPDPQEIPASLVPLAQLELLDPPGILVLLGLLVPEEILEPLDLPGIPVPQAP